MIQHRRSPRIDVPSRRRHAFRVSLDSELLHWLDESCGPGLRWGSRSDAFAELLRAAQDGNVTVKRP